MLALQPSALVHERVAPTRPLVPLLLPRLLQLLARQRIPSGQYADPLSHIFDEFDKDRRWALPAAGARCTSVLPSPRAFKFVAGSSGRHAGGAGLLPDISARCGASTAARQLGTSSSSWGMPARRWPLPTLSHMCCLTRAAVPLPVNCCSGTLSAEEVAEALRSRNVDITDKQAGAPCAMVLLPPPLGCCCCCCRPVASPHQQSSSFPKASADPGGAVPAIHPPAEQFIDAVDFQRHAITKNEFRELIMHMAAADLHSRRSAQQQVCCPASRMAVWRTHFFGLLRMARRVSAAGVGRGDCHLLSQLH